MIDRFYGEYRWLSNFEQCRIEYDGYVYSSTESAYQAQKFSGTILQVKRMKQIFTKIEPNEAKILGAIVPLREDWDSVRNDIMKEILNIKFKQEPYKTLLLETGEQELIEGNNWHDCWFGKCSCDIHNGSGENYLGKMIMEIREELKSGTEVSSEEGL